MYHITRTKSEKEPFKVVSVAANGEPINSSENFPSKQKCIKNILANRGSIVVDGDGRYCFLVQDDTGKTPKAFALYDDGSRADDYFETVPKYVPGKNKKKGKK